MANNVYTIQELKELWTMLFPQVPPPADSQWALWFLTHGPATARDGVGQLATKHRKLGGRMDASYMVKFASAVMTRISRETRQGRAIGITETPDPQNHQRPRPLDRQPQQPRSSLTTP